MDKKGDSIRLVEKFTVSIFIIILVVNINLIKANAKINEPFSNMNLNNKTYTISNRISNNNIIDNLLVALTGKVNGYELVLEDRVVGYTSLENNMNNIKDLVLQKYINEINIRQDAVLSFEIEGDIKLKEDRFDVSLLQTNKELSDYIYQLSKEDKNNIKLSLKCIDEEIVKVQPSTTIIPTEDMYLGESKVEYGEVGLKNQVREVTYKNKEITESNIIREEIIKKEVGKKIYRGTKNPYDYGMAFLKSPTRGGYMTSGYGERWNSFHKGIDIAGNIGDDVLVAMDGEVIYSQYNDGGYGNLIIVKHEDNMNTYYGHLDDFYVKVGEKVKKGDIIGAIGNTGFSTGPHLHFELRVDDEPVDPTNYIVQ